MIASFPPIISKHPKTLILGTMPGIASLHKQEYYGHPRNHFWKIMAPIYNDNIFPIDYSSKKLIIEQNELALWDVLQYCERKGSLDIHIKNPIPNPIDEFLNEHSGISKIIFNGKESEKLFLKYFGQIDQIQYCPVPSTSPANTMLFEMKLEFWRKALL
jgi:hypoxanthine-DNA glycosylase